MKEIKLSKQGKNKGKYVALVDDEDFERVNKFRWSVHIDPRNIYAKTNVSIKGKNTIMLLHRFILSDDQQLINNTQVDHINRIGLDCQKHNLRSCTKQQNAWNAGSSNNSTSKYKGVSWSKRDKIWYSFIMVNRAKFYLGIFKNEIDAAKAYDEAAKKHHKEFAYLNFK